MTELENLYQQFKRRLVFEKARRANHADGRMRVDRLGYLMRLDDFDDEHAAFGWTFDYIKPRGLGGTDDLANLRPVSFRTLSEARRQIA